MDELWPSLRLLLLLGLANTAPLVAQRWFGTRWVAPLDGGLRFFDGRPLLGSSKTIRGFLAAVAAAALGAPLVGLPAMLGALLGVGAMLGDALSSFIKRRMGAAPSSRATGLDQIPEALVPLLALQRILGLTAMQIAAITLAFFVLEIPLAWLTHRSGLRDRPY
jgi:CDP-2,3-bis-(O-geranylgeranyl)-sn-glycerol synthase